MTIEPVQATAPGRPATIIECALVDGLLRLVLSHGPQYVGARLLAGRIRSIYHAKETQCPQ